MCWAPINELEHLIMRGTRAYEEDDWKSDYFGVVELEKVFYKYVPAERIDILQNRLIRFTQPFALNDPFEAKPHFYELGSKEEFAKHYAEAIRKFPIRVWDDYRKAIGNDSGRFALAKKVNNDPDYAEWLYKNLHRQSPQDLLPNLQERSNNLHNEFGLLSLSETRDNLLMWAHYAAGHTGFVIMLDGFHDFFNAIETLPGFSKPERVEYRLERHQMTFDEINREEAIREIFFIKGSDWQYEKEWRYLKNLTDAHKMIINTESPDVHLFKLPPECIKGVILGCHSSMELTNKILELRRDDPKFGHLQILKARTSQTDYCLEMNEIEA